ncbi:hypothetical protein MPSEU_000184600 [Mayamaea pseudoterrestris]|nr:hypothetical protein MPSEU_000184600 [Mayamaea pseudoterrestris]
MAKASALLANRTMPANPTTRQADDEHPLVQTLKLIDPFLIFLTRKSGHVAIPISSLAKALPATVLTPELLQNVQALAHIGVMRFHGRSDSDLTWSDSTTQLGFPPPADSVEETAQMKELRHSFGSLHGSTKIGSKRRIKALLRVLEQQRKIQRDENSEKSCNAVMNASDATVDSAAAAIATITPVKTCDDTVMQRRNNSHDEIEPLPSDEAIQAQQDLERLLGFKLGDNEAASSLDAATTSSPIPTCILDRQVSYAGTHPAQNSIYQDLSASTLEQIPQALLQAFGLAITTQQLATSTTTRRLYRHQALAVEAALAETHCTVSTGTGSGKSMCFLLPVLTAAYQADRVSFILYPTKALAQDQLTQLQDLLQKDSSLGARIRPATLDGDTPHSTRTLIADSCNVILTNPDTLHASILPNWRHLYSKLLSRLAYVALDEAHLYEGIFGAHVTMILSRLLRVSVAAANHNGLPPTLPTFIATSATMPWPEELFRRLCPIAHDAPVLVLTSEQDGSPRAAKHFLLWNPPLLQLSDRSSTGQVAKLLHKGDLPPASAETCDNLGRKRKRAPAAALERYDMERLRRLDAADQPSVGCDRTVERNVHRRHAAEETALLLAKALVTGVRCITFCRTRNLVEWVYERTVAALKLSSSTAHLVHQLESYRGGYSKQERRIIEQKLFRGELLGVVGTNALELGVDIGGINLTLHCGYPSSYASLLQQAGRAGRDKNAIDVPSCSVVICFDSPVEQHLWRHPESLLGRGLSPSCSIPITSDLVQSHLLCASEEFPLTKEHPISVILGEKEINCLLDRQLFGREVFDEAFDELLSARGLVDTQINIPDGSSVSAYQAHFSRRKPWASVSIRAIEPVNYSLVNLAHPGQGDRMDAIHDEGAVMDTIPYSRVFYYSHPGAIILHRGTRFKIIAMSSPPPICETKTSQRSNLFLAAFARPTNAAYFTRPLSNLRITVVKTLHRIEMSSATPPSGTSGINVGDERNGIAATEIHSKMAHLDDSSADVLSFAGCGTITVKRRIRGYSKLSLVTRTELARSELSLPEFEYDTFGVWLDVDRDFLLPKLGEIEFGAGVHALSHAILAVAPIYLLGIVRQDLECDHSFYAPRRIMLFDERAGGSGACQRLWNVIFQPNSVIDAAVDLLEECRTCSSDKSYDGGCPACLQSSKCLNFNLRLSRNAGASIGRHLLSRIRQVSTGLARDDQAVIATNAAKELSPRRLARERGIRKAKEMRAAQERQFVVGRPSWPLG